MTKPLFTTTADVQQYFFPETPVELFQNFTQEPDRYTEVVAYIPARSGSTRIPDKNIKELNGIPLIAYSIAIARAMGADRIILDTDSEQYRDIGEAFGAEVPFLRPAELSSTFVSPGFASYYAARWLLREGYRVGWWITMLPTAPFRSLPVIRRFMETLLKAGTCSSVIPTPAPAEQVYTVMGKTEPFSLVFDKELTFYKPHGFFLGQVLDPAKRYWVHYEKLTNPIELIDLDTAKDWELAENILAAQCYDFGTDIC